MNKKDLVLALTKVLSTKREAKQAVERIFSTIADALRSGEKVVISGFGSFHPRHTKAKKMVNPKTKKIMLISPKIKIKFKPSKHLIKQ